MNPSNFHRVLFPCIPLIILSVGILIGREMQPEPAADEDSQMPVSSRFREREPAANALFERSSDGPRFSAGGAESAAPGELARSLSAYLTDLDRYTNDETLRQTEALVARLSPEDFLPTLEAFVAFEAAEGRLPQWQKKYELLLAAWAELNPEDTMDFLLKAPQYVRGVGNDLAMGIWAASDPDSAYAWALANHDYSYIPWNLYLPPIVRALADSDLPRATEMLKEVNWGWGGREVVYDIARKLLREDPEQAKAWASTVLLKKPEIFGGYGVRGPLALIISEENPGEAARWLSENGTPRDLGSWKESSRYVRSTVAGTLASRWYDESPAQAQEWVESLPQGVVGPAATQVVEKIAKQDPIQAAEWLVQLMEANPECNFVSPAKTLVESSARDNPEMAAEWISVMEPRLQPDLYRSLLSVWKENEPQAARAWAEANQAILPESAKAKFFNGQ